MIQEDKKIKKTYSEASTDQNMDFYKSLEETFNVSMHAHHISTWRYDIGSRSIQNFQGDKDELTEAAEHIDRNVDDFMRFFIHPEYLERAKEFIADIESGSKKGRAQTRALDPLGPQYLWFECTFQNVFDSEGNAIYAICSGRKIELEKQMEEQFHREMQFHSEQTDKLVASIRVNLSQDKIEERYINGNRESEQVTENIHNILEGMSCFYDDVQVSEETKNTFSREHLIRKYEEGQNTFEGTLRARKRGTSDLMYILTKCRLMMRPGSNDVIALFEHFDHTEYRVLDLITKGSLKFDYIEAGTINTMTGIYYAYHNGRAEIIINEYNLGLQEFIRERIPKDQQDIVYEKLSLKYIKEALEITDLYTYEFDVTVADGTSHRYQIRCAYMESGIIVYTESDIQNLLLGEKKKQAELAVALEDAEQANHAKTEFLARMSHDMRTPLNSILNFARFIEDSQSIEEAKELARKIVTSGNYLQTLINDTLGMSRIESGKITLKLEPYIYADFQPSVQNVLEVRAKEKGVALKFVAPKEKSMRVMIDKLRFQQIFINITNNAIKFTPAGGTVIVKTQLLNQTKRGETIRILISDNGIGVSETFLPHIFEPFQQEQQGIDNENTGTGLGLSIVKELVDLMGGTITCESAVGVGTSFTVDIPVAAAEPEKSFLSESKRYEQGDLKNCHVLLCEDHPLNLEIAKRLLEKAECVVELARNGEEAILKYQASDQNPFDIVLMDIRMPVMDGIQATKHIRFLERNTGVRVPVIAMTANVYEEDVKTYLSIGMDAHIPKPIQPEYMYQTMWDMFEK